MNVMNVVDAIDDRRRRNLDVGEVKLPLGGLADRKWAE
jgi:hypothetical protein